MKYTIIKARTNEICLKEVDEETALKYLKITKRLLGEKIINKELIRGTWRVETVGQAAKFLRITARTMRDKARFHEPIRGAWYVIAENPEPVKIPKEQLIKTGFKENEWLQFCDDWHAACLRLALFAPHPVARLEGERG